MGIDDVYLLAEMQHINYEEYIESKRKQKKISVCYYISLFVWACSIVFTTCMDLSIWIDAIIISCNLSICIVLCIVKSIIDAKVMSYGKEEGLWNQ